MNAFPPDNSKDGDSEDKAKRRRLSFFGIALALASAFMYVSFIIKTAVRGP